MRIRHTTRTTTKSWLMRQLLHVIPFVLLLLLLLVVDAKHTSGNFKLSGVQTEYVLSSFAVEPAGAKFEMKLTSPTMYENELALKVRAYRDTEWNQFLKEPLCTKKIQLARRTHAVSFHEPTTNGGSTKWTADITIEIDNLRKTSSDPAEIQLREAQERSEFPRSHYWYFVIDDCSLEQYYHDNAIPKVQYELDVRNYRGKYRQRFTHLSADERSLIDLHGLCLLISIMVAMILLFNILWKIYDSKHNHSVHAAVIWVGTAALLDASSTICELIHLNRYHNNGIGIYIFDALSAHMEACCDAALMIFLLSIAAGWTLPSSMIHITVQQSTANANLLQKIIAGLAHPISQSMMSGPSGILAGSVILLHVILAQWGRIYNDDFESYHDLEHLPGRILLWIRVITGFLFVMAVQQTTSSGSIPTSLQKFYTNFTIAGFIWFESLPVWIWYCNFAIPYYMKRPFVFCGAALLQSTSLIILAWLVTTHRTAYHKYSHISTSRDTLSDSLAASTSATLNTSSSSSSTGPNANLPVPASPTKSWTLGKKIKVRLD